MLIFNPCEFNPENIRKLGQASRAPKNNMAGLVAAVALAAGGAARHGRRGRNRMESSTFTDFQGEKLPKESLDSYLKLPILESFYMLLLIFRCGRFVFQCQASLRMINPHDEHTGHFRNHPTKPQPTSRPKPGRAYLRRAAQHESHETDLWRSFLNIQNVQRWANRKQSPSIVGETRWPIVAKD